MPDRDELIRRQREFEAVYEEVKAQLMQYPGVVGVGIGVKETGGEMTPQFAFRVYVEEKKDPSEIPPDEVIPEEIMGFLTDVHIVPTSTAIAFTERRDRQKYRAIRGGISIETEGRSSYGTLGWFGIRSSDSAPVLLTNKHVLYDGTQDSTTEAQTIGQPSVSNVCCCSCNDIGTSVIGINDTNVDCALAKLNSNEVPSLLIQNDTAGVEIHVSGTASAVMGETVRKIGARSAFTTGVVVEVSGPSNTSYNTDSGDTVTIHRSNEIIVRAADAETYVIENGKPSFSNHGDSGSVVVNDGNQVIGLLYGVGNSTNTTILTMVSHISSVLSALSSAGQAITLSVTPGGGSADDYGIAPPAQAALTGTRLDDVLLRVLGDDVETHPFIQAAQTHFDEMLDLVNHSRPVTVAWHRKQGPAFLAAFMRSAKEPNYRIPQEIEGITRQHALTMMITVFEEHGSEALKAAIERYGLEVLFACSRYDTVDEIVQALYDSQAARV